MKVEKTDEDEFSLSSHQIVLTSNEVLVVELIIRTSLT